MSTILLPALRSARVNLITYSAAGQVYSGTGSTLNTPSDDRTAISDVGLAVGDRICGSADVRNSVSGENTRLELRAFDSGGSILDTVTSVYANNTEFTRHVCGPMTLPANTRTVYLFVRRESGSGAISFRRSMINRGPTAQPYDVPKRGALAPFQIPVRFGREGSQSISRTPGGVAQITSYPSRLWFLSGETIPLVEDELRKWLVAMDLLSDLSNTFRHVVPDYQGPSTGYEGANPVVKGASQLGTSLDCDGVDASTAIAKAGDYASIETTSAKGNTNSQLFRLKSDATSDASGNVTLEFTTPIRQAPGDNAMVQIFAPTAQFGLTAPLHAYDLQLIGMASLPIQAEERVLP